jgi:hypothetical protein
MYAFFSEWNLLQNRSYPRTQSKPHSKYKKTDIVRCILYDHNAIKLQLNNKNKDKKQASRWKPNNSLLNEQRVIDEIKEEIKKFWNSIKMKTQPTRTYGTQQRQS